MKCGGLGICEFYFSGIGRMEPTTIKYVFPTELNGIIDYSKVNLPIPNGITIEDIINHGNINVNYEKPTKRGK